MLLDTPPVSPEDRWHEPPATERAPSPPRRRPATALVIAAALFAGAGTGWLLAGSRGGGAPGAAAVPAALAGSGHGDIDVHAVVDAVEPSVVSVATRMGHGRSSGGGAGTGVVLDGGLVLTNAHVVAGATAVVVTGVDGRARDAELVAADETQDIAVLRLADHGGLLPATLGLARDVRVGDDVVAIGNALALEGGLTVTRGIVSALDRSIDAGTGTLSHLVQTDAAISSGNSGGPLVNAAGEVIGINTAVATGGGRVAAANIGFAIAIDHAMTIVDRLLG